MTNTYTKTLLNLNQYKLNKPKTQNEAIRIPMILRKFSCLEFINKHQTELNDIYSPYYQAHKCQPNSSKSTQSKQLINSNKKLV